MGFDDKIENEGQDLAGKAKEAFGEATDNESLKNEGKADQFEATVKKGVEKAKDLGGDAAEKAKELGENAVGKVKDLFNKN